MNKRHERVRLGRQRNVSPLGVKSRSLAPRRTQHVAGARTKFEGRARGSEGPLTDRVFIDEDLTFA